MLEFLRDPMWQFVGTVLTLAAIMVSIFLFLRQRRRKFLSYEVISCTPLLSVGEEIKNGLQILYNSKPVQQVHLVLIRIFNSGNIPILTKDYEQPISLSFGEQSRILTTGITQKIPDNLPASIRAEEKRMVLLPTLLNQGDSVTLKMLVSEFGEIAVDSRVVGVKEIEQFSSHHKRLMNRVIAGALTELGAVVVIFLLPHEVYLPFPLIPMAMLAIALVSAYVAIKSLIKM